MACLWSAGLEIKRLQVQASPEALHCMRRSRKIFQRGSNFDYDLKFFFLVDEGTEDPNTWAI